MEVGRVWPGVEAANEAVSWPVVILRPPFARDDLPVKPTYLAPFDGILLKRQVLPVRRAHGPSNELDGARSQMMRSRWCSSHELCVRKGWESDAGGASW